MALVFSIVVVASFVLLMFALFYLTIDQREEAAENYEAATEEDKDQ